MNAKLIVKMDGKQTRLLKPVRTPTSGRESTADSNNFTFDYSYWSFDKKDSNFTSQNQVYDDLGTDVINCAFQGKLRLWLLCGLTTTMIYLQNDKSSLSLKKKRLQCMCTCIRSNR